MRESYTFCLCFISYILHPFIPPNSPNLCLNFAWIMADRKMMMMNWDDNWENCLDDDEDEFLDSRDRMSCAVTLDLPSSPSGSDDDEDEEEYDDSRISFASAISATPDVHQSFAMAAAAASMSVDYNIWMAEPESIKDRRQRLLKGMGLSADKELLRISSIELKQAPTTTEPQQEKTPLPKPIPTPPSSGRIIRSKSEANVSTAFVDSKQRKEELVGEGSEQKKLLRTFSLPLPLSDKRLKLICKTIQRKRSWIRSLDRKESQMLSLAANSGSGGPFLIKNLDTGKVFLINEDGTSSSLSDLQTGKQLTMEEFEKTVGHSPIVKELMRRENVARVHEDGDDRKIVSISNATLSKSFKSGKRKGAGWLKNIKGVANSLNGLIVDRDKDHPSCAQLQPNPGGVPSKWTKVHQHGKSSKELSGLYMCQEIQAHQGSIWSIRFSSDARYLASAGEDRIIHIWEVIDCDVFSSRTPDDGNSTPVHPMAAGSPDRSLVEAQLLHPEKKKKGKAHSIKKGRSVPEYVVVPETVFSLSDKPVCSFEGHLDDVLDLSWSKSQQLLSSSMDKTVRLWDMDSKTCLKLFAHNDYVTCIQFNPMDDSYFISGSLDAKVRIWSIPERKVVDWSDLHEMVTAVCYTPDGQGALVGSHKGSCRLYNTSECKLHQKGQIDVQNKKKSQAKKITGFQFAPGNASEVLITSADSRIRIFDGADVTYKFTGFRNTSSQISASFSCDGKYVVCASEDSQVYIWKRDELRNVGGGKSRGLVTTRAYERFQCKDVSVAIPWPGSIKYEPLLLPTLSKRYSRRPSMQPPLSAAPSTRQDAYINSKRNNLPPPGPSTLQDAFMSSRRNLPPLPKKNNTLCRVDTCVDEDPANACRSDSGIGENASFSSACTSFRYGDSTSRFGDSPSISASESSFSSLSWLFENEANSGGNTNPAAWGLVVVTAGLGGEIRIYQNFGLPLRLNRQTNLFRDII